MADKLSAREWHEKNRVKYWNFDPLSDGIVHNIHRLEEGYAKYFAAELEAEIASVDAALTGDTAFDGNRATAIESLKAQKESLQQRAETAEARLTAAREVLKALEWAGNGFGEGLYCLSCIGFKDNGHAPGCALDAVLNKGGATDGR